MTFLGLQRCSPPSLVLSLSPGLGADGLPSPGGATGHYNASNPNGNSNRSSPFSSSEQVLPKLSTNAAPERFNSLVTSLLFICSS